MRTRNLLQGIYETPKLGLPENYQQGTYQDINMKWFLPLFFLPIVLPAYTQPDSLLKLSFNERYPILEKLLKKAPSKEDSLKLCAELAALSDFAKRSGNKELQLEAKTIWFRQNRLFKGNDDLDLIETEFVKLLETVQKSNYKRLVAMVEFDLAEFYWDLKKNLNLAMLHYDNAYRLAKGIKDEDYYLKERIFYKIGEKYYYLTDYPSAILYLQEADKVNNPLDPVHPKISIFNTMGLAYRLLDDLDNAEASFRKAIEYAKMVDSKAWIGNLSGNLGYVRVLKGDFAGGERLLQIDKNMSLARGSKNSASGALLQLAKMSVDNGNMKRGMEQVDSAFMLMKYNVPYHRKKTYYQILSKISAYQGAWKAAAVYLDSAIVVSDSLAKKDNVLQMLRLKQRVELEESKVEIAQAEARDKRRTLQIYAMIAGLLLAIVTGFLILRQKRKTDRAKKRSDELLLNILPANVAEELKATGTSKARRFSGVTVLFSDFKNFTTYSEQMNPSELVTILDDYFKGFDRIVSAFGLEKIKTVGDAYICVCGLPTEDSQHAQKTVQAALRIQDYMKNSPAGWELRIGIHSGSVVAGVVGITKFSYDIWGDTVNVAARMEQNSEPGKINISQATYELAKDAFECSYRGKLEAKNKGALDMYFVERAL